MHGLDRFEPVRRQPVDILTNRPTEQLTDVLESIGSVVLLVCNPPGPHSHCRVISSSAIGR